MAILYYLLTKMHGGLEAFEVKCLVTWSFVRVFSVKGLEIWNACLERWETCGVNAITGDTLLRGTVRTGQVKRNRVAIKYSYTSSRARKR